MKSLLDKSLQSRQSELDIKKRKELDIEKYNKNEQQITLSGKIENFNTNTTSTIINERALENKHQTRSIFFVQSSEKIKIIKRIRRNSECCTRTTTTIPKIRRKSCDNFNYSIREPISHCYKSNKSVLFNEVESQLEKMFAGIIEGDEKRINNQGMVIERPNLSNKQNMLKNKNIKELSFVNNVSNIANDGFFQQGNEKSLSNAKKNPDKKKNTCNTKKFLDSLSESSIKNKKNRLSYKKSLKNGKNINKKKNNKIDHFRESFTEVVNGNHLKYKGPIIQLKNSKMNTTHVEIVNVPREEDEEKNKEKRKVQNNTILGKSKSLNRHQNNLDYRGNYRVSELFNSTLSSRYDACTADSTWICVFCKKGPHFLVEASSFLEKSIPLSGNEPISACVLSDLFGPFSVMQNIAGSDSILTYNNDVKVVNIQGKQQNENKYGSKYPVIINQFLSKSKTMKTYFPEEKEYSFMDISMTNVIDDCYEVWVHEQCIIWSVGVYVTGGGRINGLQDAVRDSIISVCSFCGNNGANIKCLKKGCKFIVHYCCAINSAWHLNVKDFISKCNIHK
ncbi:uncharacterized protein CG5098 [Phymastichus coffea]|uniref:uncharacterized protein CG5098 n=1 Tax=Phymastichus coffea TaxID=108790 RepID=UPI00273C4339|nr:uncharacterized protein CG5098 [Phymastichus coffea]